MANNIWIISDTHFGHANFLNFTNEKGEKIRKFDAVDQMDEYMVEKWNSVIKPDDKIYHLGDVFFGDPDNAHHNLKKLHGKKRLILGNHDYIEKSYPIYNGPGIIERSVLLDHFKKILLWRVFGKEGIIFSHLPLHPEHVINHEKYDKRFMNVHGHIHDKMMKEPFYFNACVEHHDYTPIHFDDILAEKRKRNV